MKHKYIGVIVLLIFTGMFFEVSSMVDGALNMTGAPSEGDCSGCHGGTANSDPNGSVSIKVIGDPVKYFPGSTYDIQVTTSYPSKTKFGFALNARMGGTVNVPVGKFTGSTDMQVRDFVTHTRNSTAGTNSKTWTFTWQAPVDGTQDIVLYAAGLATNADNNNTGDKVFTTSYKFQGPGAAGVEDAKLNSMYQLFPNPCQGLLHVSGKTLNDGLAEIAIYDFNGKLVYLDTREVFRGNYELEVQLPNQLSSGVYYLVFKQGEIHSSKKFVLQ